MNAPAKAKQLLKTLALREGLLIRRVPRGRQGDPFADQTSIVRASGARHVFDVGAHDGQTAIAYLRLFPNATIHCFEPLRDSFKQLERRLAGVPRTVVNRLAVGESRNPIELYVSRFGPASSRFRPAPDVDRVVGAGVLDVVGTQMVQSTTVDQYCSDREIDHVDVLKLDIQGGELAAVRGAERMLAGGRISLVFFEVLVRELYESQPTAGELLRALEEHGYRIYGLYNFVFGADTSLYQMDTIMVSPALLPK